MVALFQHCEYDIRWCFLLLHGWLMKRCRKSYWVPALRMTGISCSVQQSRSTRKAAVIDVPAEARLRSSAADVRPAPGPVRPLAPALFWAAATLAGLLCMLAVLCACAYAPLHYLLLLAQSTSSVRPKPPFK